MRQDTVKTHFLLHEVVVLTGFSKHMLDYLVREEIFAPQRSPGKGRPRQYSYADVVLLRALHQICATAGRIRHLRASLRRLRDEVGTLTPGQQLGKMLLVEGRELCLRESDALSVQLRTGQLTLGFVLDLADACAKVTDCLELSSDGWARLKPEQASEAEACRQRHWVSVRQQRSARAANV